MSSLRTCFVSAPAGTNLSVLHELLAARGIDSVAPELPLPGGSAGEALRKVLGEVDLVIGVLTRERRSSWALFELGVAFGFGRRILLLTSPGAGDYVPGDWNGLIKLRAELGNRDAIGFALDQLLASSKIQPAPEQGEEDVALYEFAHASRYRSLIRQAVSDRRGDELERLLARSIEESGGAVLAARHQDTHGADIAVWADELLGSIGNPLLIEVKLSVRDRAGLREVASHFSRRLSSAGAFWGLLVLGEAPAGRLAERPFPPNVLAITADDLLLKMSSTSFAAVVTGLRNRRVHGVGD